MFIWTIMHFVKCWDLLRLVTVSHLGISSVVSQVQINQLILLHVIPISLISILLEIVGALYRWFYLGSLKIWDLSNLFQVRDVRGSVWSLAVRNYLRFSYFGWIWRSCSVFLDMYISSFFAATFLVKRCLLWARFLAGLLSLWEILFIALFLVARWLPLLWCRHQPFKRLLCKVSFLI